MEERGGIGGRKRDGEGVGYGGREGGGSYNFHGICLLVETHKVIDGKISNRNSCDTNGTYGTYRFAYKERVRR